MPFGSLTSAIAVGLVVLLALPFAAPADELSKASKYWLYVGTYTGKASKGIYRFDFDPATGKLGNMTLAAEATNPSFLAIHPSRKYLYAVGEVNTLGGKKTGGVSAYSIDPKSGNLTRLNEQSSGGAGPCHIVVDKEGKNALVANYGGGSAAVLSIGADGKLGEPSTVQHKGSSVNASRQKEPHAHSINLDPANKFAFVADLGLDKVMVYRFDGSKSTLTANDPPAGLVAPGSGPRHFAFHPSGKYAYVINEMGNTVTVYSYDGSKGELKEIQSVTTLPADFKGTSYTAEVVVHPSGKFLYGSNRGQDSIAAFAIDQQTGKLTPVGHQGDKVKWPRNFNVDPTGRFLLVANERGNSIVVFRIDGETGKLEPTGETVEVGSPVCLRFIPAER